ncbi:MAG: AMP-binding protein [Motiliproteus sp.]
MMHKILQPRQPSPSRSLILDRIARHAQRTPDAPALQDSQSTLSYAELQARIEALSMSLQASGFEQLGLLMDNGTDWIICQLAALHAGLCVTPIPLFFSPTQAHHLLDSCGIELLLCDQLSRLSELSIDAIQRPDIHRGAVRCRNVQARPLSRPKGTCLITFTSGTTGTPKGVCLSSASLDQLCHALYQQIEPLQIERHTSLLPLSVLLEHVAGVLLSLYAGAHCSLYAASHTGLSGSGQLDPAALTVLLQHSQPQSLILVPELLQALVALAAHGQAPDSLRFIAVGGGHLPPQLRQQAQQLSLPVYEGYGLSECGSVVSLNTPQQQRCGSVGKPLPHCQVKLADDHEILVRGAAMLGYLGEPVQQDEWLATGDIGALDGAGYLHIQGRKRNLLINSFGRNLSPEWIEAELCASPLIAQACLFGDARPFNVALITAAAEASDAAIDNQIEQLNDRLPDYARVGDWVTSRIPFSSANGLLTPNCRLRREQIQMAYQSAIDACYRPDRPQNAIAAPLSESLSAPLATIKQEFV